MRATIKKVAEYAGVSRGTVDRVIHKRGNVKPEVKERVLEAIKVLDYKPNIAARSLALNRNSKKISIILPSQQGHFKNEIHRGIQRAMEECSDTGIEILTYEYDENIPQEYIEIIDQMVAEGVCGFAIKAQNTISTIEKINELIRNNIPVITFNSDIPESNRSAFIGENTYQVGKVAGEIIYKYLNREDRILIVTGYPEFDAHVNRAKGFCDYLKEQGIGNDRYEVIFSYENYNLTYQKILETILGDSSIRNIYMATNSNAACGDAIKEANLDYRIFVVCHDASPTTIELMKEGIIDFTIVQDLYKQGYTPLILLRDYYLSEKPIKYSVDDMGLYIQTAECFQP